MNGTDQEIMLSVVKDHVYGLIFQNDFLEGHNIIMVYFSVELEGLDVSEKRNVLLATHRNLPDGALTDASIRDHVTLLVRFELLYGVNLLIVTETLRLVYTSIGPRRDEAENAVFRRNCTMSFISFGAVQTHRIMKNT